MFDSPALALFVLVALIFVGSYAVGTQYNVRLGNNALKWMQKGLPLVGEKAALRWLGSSVAELKINKAKDPFRSAEILVVMEPRDVPGLWVWAHARGRRDLVIFRAQLRKAPHFDVEARAPRAWAGPHMAREDRLKYSAVQGGVANDMAADYRGDISPYSINRLIVATSVEGLKLTRLSVHGAVPNIEVHFLLPKFDQVSAQRVFTGLRQLGDQALNL